MSLQPESPTAVHTRAARAKLEKSAANLLSSRNLSHWRPYLAAASCLLPYELEESHPAALAPTATIAEIKEVALKIADGDVSGDERQLPSSEAALVDEFRRICVCYRGNSNLFQSMMSKAIMPSSLTSRAFADSPGKGSPRDARSTTKTVDDRRRAEFNRVLHLRKVMYAMQNDNCPPSLDETPKLDAAKPCLNSLEADPAHLPDYADTPWAFEGGDKVSTKVPVGEDTRSWHQHRMRVAMGVLSVVHCYVMGEEGPYPHVRISECDATECVDSDGEKIAVGARLVPLRRLVHRYQDKTESANATGYQCRELAKRIFSDLTNRMHAQRRSLTWAVELLLETPATFDLPAAAARTERIAAKPRAGAPSTVPVERRSCYDFDRHGGCEYGADCRYLHGGRPAAKNPGKKPRGKGKAKREREKDSPPFRRRRDDAESEDESPRRKRRDTKKE